jgi:hypothetical protein
MPGVSARQKELEMRLMNLIDILQEEHEDCPEPPECAASEWTESEVRRLRFMIYDHLFAVPHQVPGVQRQRRCIRSQPHATLGSLQSPVRIIYLVL